MSRNIIISTFQRILNILSKGFIRRSGLLVSGIFVNSLFEIIGLASILPVLAAVLKKGFIHENPYTEYFYVSFGFPSDNVFIIALCSAIFLFILVKNIFGIWVQKKQSVFSWDLHENISSRILQNAYSRGFLYFSQNNSNKIMNRVFSVPLQFAQHMLLHAFQFVNEIIILSLIIISLLVYDYLILLLLVSIVLPVFLTFYKVNKKKISNFGIKLNDLSPQIAKPVFEVIFGFVDVVTNGIFKSFKNQYLNKNREAKSIRVSMTVIQNIPNRLIEISVILAVMVMLLYGLFLLKETDKILTLMSVFGLAAYRTIPSINRLMLAVVNIKNYQFTLDIIEEYLTKQTHDSEAKSLEFNNLIKLDKVAYKYPDADHPALSEISLEIAKGESVGIIGKSGSGKTTLMNLMLGFFSPSQGNIYIDNIKLTPSHLSSWYKKCGYVRQDVFLIDGSLTQNIAFGVLPDDIDQQRLEKVIEQAQLTSMVANLNDGLNTNIGERGAKISGGQRQRVGIARALYHGAEVLFFDEATSALDSETEEEITEAIRMLNANNLTTIIIAHRKSTLKYCDRIIDIKERNYSQKVHGNS